MEREGLVVAEGVGGQVGEATDLEQSHLGHCVRTRSWKKEQKHGFWKKAACIRAKNAPC